MNSRKTMMTEKSIMGIVDYDSELYNLSSNQCDISVSYDIDLKRGVFIKIGNEESYYIGQVVDGPYFTKGSIKSRYIIELVAKIENDVPKVVLTRPAPGTSVEPIESRIVQKFLGITGIMNIGHILTDNRIDILMDTATLSRHIGIFGTTGSGKSNTIQVLMEEACNQGYSIMIFDVEGEYVQMDQPTDRLLDILSKFDRKPTGVKDLNVYVPYPCDSKREDATRFGISFKDVDKDVFSEVSGLNRMEQLYFQDIIDKVKAVTPETKSVTLEAVINRLVTRLKGQTDRPTMPPFIAEAHTTLFAKLRLMSEQKIVDVDTPIVNMDKVIKPGRVSVIDVSDASDYIRNVVMAELLHNAFKFKINHPESPPLFAVIEEAHAFISKEKRDRMLATLMLIIEVARRGRKRGLCLGIVTQQPAHLPSELLELCNTRIIHRMSSAVNIDCLKESTGNVPDGMWNTVPSLGVGESLLSSHKYSRALAVQVRPTVSRRIATD
jgi:DNA helicase HerA-like ATPase